MKKLLSVAVVFFAATLQAQTIKIGAGGIPLQNIFQKIQEPFEKATKIKLDLKKAEPHTALEALDKGEFDAVSVGLNFKDWIAQAAKSGYKVADEKAYKSKVIGRDTLIVVVSTDTKIKKLSSAQLKGILSGTIKNWKEAGGPDMEITFVRGTNTPGMDGRLAKAYLKGSVMKAAKTVEVLSKDLEEKVVSTAGAIAYGPKALAENSKLKEVELDLDLSSSVTLLTKGEPKPEVKKLLDFLSAEGSKYIVK